MFMLKHILWIIVTLYIHALLPVCNAIKDNWMEDENIDTKILLKLRRRLLDTSDYNSSSKEFLFYFIALFFVALVAAYVKCCIDMAKSTVEEDDAPYITQHPPPACRITDISSGSARPRYLTRLPSGSRPLAPPRTSTSIILLPEERQFDSLFIGIANPLYNASISNEQVGRDLNASVSNEQVGRDLSASIYNEQVGRDLNTSISNEQVQRDVNFSIFTEQIRRDFNIPISNDQEQRDGNLLSTPTDMPPNYESAVKDDEKCTVYSIQGPPYDEPPPKYSEF